VELPSNRQRESDWRVAVEDGARLLRLIGAFVVGQIEVPEDPLDDSLLIAVRDEPVVRPDRVAVGDDRCVLPTPDPSLPARRQHAALTACPSVQPPKPGVTAWSDLSTIRRVDAH
jgi:hypothetical protein